MRVPDDGDVRRAAEVLDGAGKPAVLVGSAGRAAAGQAVGVASLLGAGVATTALARDALPDWARDTEARQAPVTAHAPPTGPVASSR
ncbi:hypothetical protein ACQPXS_06060 [Streptomyces sp. CA-142005]|uniref:hypothetical protein n=1 Tax=Streptomyces sp. CA-142005 TaxID=3240052 RepID=UPI003D943EEE